MDQSLKDRAKRVGVNYEWLKIDWFSFYPGDGALKLIENVKELLSRNGLTDAQVDFDVVDDGVETVNMEWFEERPEADVLRDVEAAEAKLAVEERAQYEALKAKFETNS